MTTTVLFLFASILLGSVAEPTPPPTTTPAPPPLPTRPIAGVHSLADLGSRIKLRKLGNEPIAITNRDGAAATRPPGPLPATTPRIGDAEPLLLDIVAYKKGDGIEVYAVAEDRAGREIALPGYYTIVITGSGRHAVRALTPWGDTNAVRLEDFEKRLYFRDGTVAEGDFTVSTVGIGAFARPRLLLSFGRIPFTEMALESVSSLTLAVVVALDPGNTPRISGGTTLRVF